MANRLPQGMRHVAALHHEEHVRRHAIFKSYHAGDQHTRIHEKIRERKMLDPIESAYALQEGNKGHAARVSGFQGEMPEKIKTLMLVCADARMGGMFDFDDFARRGIAAVYVAGNVSDFLNTSGVKEVFRRMDKDSSIVITGHAKCGAVHCASEKERYSHLKNIAILLHLVSPTGELDNLRAQAGTLAANEAFQKLTARKNVRIVSAFVDIAHHEPQIRLVDGDKAQEQDRELIDGLDRAFRRSNGGMDLSSHQFAHAVVISGPALPFDAREIFSAGSNEIFCVTGGDYGGKKHKGHLSETEIASVEMASLGMLDEQSVASIEYSVEKNKSQHILLLHTDLAVIDAWEAQLIRKSDIVSNALIEGRLEITTAVYDSSTGRVTMVRHLVNEDAAAAISAKA